LGKGQLVLITSKVYEALEQTAISGHLHTNGLGKEGAQSSKAPLL